jgi:hypothetical protein
MFMLLGKEGGDFYILHTEDSIRITELEEAVQLPNLSQDERTNIEED